MKHCLFFLFLCSLMLADSQGINCLNNEYLNSTIALKLAGIAIEGLQQAYPTIIHHVLNSDNDIKPHYVFTPVFYGSYDWHSAAHTTWQLIRLVRIYPNETYVASARNLLNSMLTSEKLRVEVEYMQEEGRSGFERPYGLAWLLQLVAELIEWNDPEGNVWRQNLIPLEQQALISLSSWFPKLTHPIRIGEHSQTAFAMGLILDYARTSTNSELESLIVERSLTFHRSDVSCPLHQYEPSGHDFLSPCLGEADLMRRVVSAEDFSNWLDGLLPGMPTNPEEGANWLIPVKASDPNDGKLAHFDGLNLSRGWMLEGIRFGLPGDDSRRQGLTPSIEAHRKAGMDTVLGDMGLMSSHWLGSFAVYLNSCRGLN